jgi:hypothetical protein
MTPEARQKRAEMAAAARRKRDEEAAAARRKRDEEAAAAEYYRELQAYATKLFPHWYDLNLDPAWMHLLLGLDSKDEVPQEVVQKNEVVTWGKLTSALEDARARLNSKGVPMPASIIENYQKMKQHIQNNWVPKGAEYWHDMTIEQLWRMINTNPTWTEWAKYQYNRTAAESQRRAAEKYQDYLQQRRPEKVEDDYVSAWWQPKPL